jgi:hypothetical protein
VKPSYSPGKLECIFDAFHYTSVDPKEKLFAVTDCLPNYEELKQDFQNDEEQMAKELARAMDACGKEKCRKEQNAKKNARNKLNSDKPTTVKKDTSSFFDYNKCITQKCDTIYKKQMNHFGKQFTMKNYKAYTKKGTRKRGVYNQLRGLFSRR